MDDRTEEGKLDLQSAAGATVSVRIAGLGGRGFAYVIDWHIKLLLALGWFLAAMMAISGGLSLEAFDSASGDVLIYWAVIPAAAIFLLYHPVLEMLMKGRTPGKRMAGIRVLSKEGQTPSTGALLIRNIFRVVDSLPVNYLVGILVALFDRQAARIGDIAAGTLLVYEPDTRSADVRELTALEPGRLDPRQRELVVELLERWPQLNRMARSRMARELLGQFGIEAPPFSSAKQYDRDHRVALEGLLHS